MKNKKNKGSAMILSILLLAFFMALSLNMFYMTQKKAQRAGYKVKGQTAFSGIDESSTLGYHELYLAGELVNIGSLFTASHSAITSNSGYFSNPTAYTTQSGVVAGTYAGIALSNYTEYFNSAWNITSGGVFDTSTDQAIIYSNTTSDSALLSRSWNNDANKSYRLWQDNIYNDYISVGGYTLTKLTVDNDESIELNDNGIYFFSNASESYNSGTHSAKAIYEKKMEIGTGASLIVYTIEVTEEIEFSVTPSAVSLDNLSSDNIEITSEQLTEIIVEKGAD